MISVSNLRRAVYLHPLLFTLFPPLFLYHYNITEVFSSELPLVLLLAGAGGIALFVLALLICRGNRPEAALLTTYLTLVLAAYPLLFLWQHIPIEAITAGPKYRNLALTGIACVAVIIACVRFKHSLKEHVFWCLLGILLVGYNAVPILLSARKHYIPKTVEAVSDAYTFPAVDERRLPHIIYIVPDRYPSKQALSRYFGFDNGAFLASLQRRKFFVQETSFANYTKTFQALAAVFNMQYLDFIPREFGANARDKRPVNHLLKEHEGLKILRRAGYAFLNMGNWWQPTRYNPHADENFSESRTMDGFTEFQSTYITINPLTTFLERSQAEKELDCTRIPAQYEKLLEAVQRDRPQFIFWHLLLPHPPYIFDGRGRCPALVHDTSWGGYKKGFLQQLNYGNSLLLRAFDQVSGFSSRDFIFVIQSDEGPFPWRYRRNRWVNWWAATPDELKMKFGTINAIYFRSGRYGKLQGEITPINNFRHVLNEALGMQMPLLPHHVYTFLSEGHPYQFREITPVLQAKP